VAEQALEVKGVVGLHVVEADWPPPCRVVKSKLGFYPRPVIEVT